MSKISFISFASDAFVKGSVSKLSVVARMIFRKDVGTALKMLDFCSRRGARDIRKILYSAVLNAQNNHGFADVGRLYVADVCVGKSTSLKRFMPRARGRGDRILKRYSMVAVKLSEIVV